LKVYNKEGALFYEYEDIEEENNAEDNEEDNF